MDIEEELYAISEVASMYFAGSVISHLEEQAQLKLFCVCEDESCNIQQ